MRWWFTRNQQEICKYAIASNYVTTHALQRRYPPTHGTFTTHASSIVLKANDFVLEPRPATVFRKQMFRLICVGTLSQLYKAQDVLLDAVAQAISEGSNLELVLVGDGQHRNQLEEQAQRLGIAERVTFLVGFRLVMQYRLSWTKQTSSYFRPAKRDYPFNDGGND